MSTRSYICKTPRIMEMMFAELQELYTHVEFLSYDGRRLTVAYIA